jgi:hypothetical protein
MLEHRWNKCIKPKGDYVKKYIFCFVELFLKVGQGWSIGITPRIIQFFQLHLLVFLIGFAIHIFKYITENLVGYCIDQFAAYCLTVALKL